MTDLHNKLVKGRRISIGVPMAQESQWALCYLHDWDPPKPGQEHRWEPGKNIFPEVHGVYDDYRQAAAVQKDMGNGSKYWIVRARPESLERLKKIGAL